MGCKKKRNGAPVLLCYLCSPVYTEPNRPDVKLLRFPGDGPGHCQIAASLVHPFLMDVYECNMNIIGNLSQVPGMKKIRLRITMNNLYAFSRTLYHTVSGSIEVGNYFHFNPGAGWLWPQPSVTVNYHRPMASMAAWVPRKDIQSVDISKTLCCPQVDIRVAIGVSSRCSAALCISVYLRQSNPMWVVTAVKA